MSESISLKRLVNMSNALQESALANEDDNVNVGLAEFMVTLAECTTSTEHQVLAVNVLYSLEKREPEKFYQLIASIAIHLLSGA